MEQILKIIHQVEKTHKGLGVACSFAFLTCLARKGLFLIASRGVGKGSVIKSVNHFNKNKNYKVAELDSTNLHDLIDKTGDEYGKTLIWKIEEWSTLSEYNRQLILPIASKIITEGSYEKHISEDTKIKIVECNLVFMVGIQPLKMQKMMQESDTWESLTTDRMTKLVLINPFRRKQDFKREHPTFEINKDIIDNNDYIKIDTDLNLTMDLFLTQVSEGRAKLFAIDYLTAFAKYNNYEKITVRVEKEFYELYFPYLKLYQALLYTSDIDKQDKISAGALRLVEKISRSEKPLRATELAQYFHVYKKKEDDDSYEVDTHTINYHMKILKYNDIVQNKKDGNVPYYSLSKEYKDYFDNYKRNWIK